MNSLTFLFVQEILISPFAWFSRYRILSWHLFFQHFEYIILLSSGMKGFCWEIIPLSYGGALVCSFSLFSYCFQNCFLCLFDFWQLYFIMCLGVFLFRFSLFGKLWASWTLMFISLSKSGKFSAISALNTLSVPFSFSGIPINVDIVLLIVSHKYHRLSSFFFIFFNFSPLTG